MKKKIKVKKIIAFIKSLDRCTKENFEKYCNKKEINMLI